MNVRCRCMSFISVFRRSTLLLCRVGVTTYDYDVPLWRNRILRIQDRNTTKREEGGRADSWWNPQRTKGFATLLIISDHSVWFIMVCMLHSFTWKSSFSSDHFIMICMLTGLHSTQCIQIISSSNQNFIRSSSWRSLSNLCLSFWDSLPNAYCSSFKFKGLTIYSDWYQ